MKNQRFLLPRRTVLKALGSLAASPLLQPGGPALAAPAAPLALRLEPSALPLRENEPKAGIWSLEGGSAPLASRIAPGDISARFANQTPRPAGFEVRGLNGGTSVATQKPLQPGANMDLALPLRQTGTFLLDPRLLSDGADRATQPRVLVVEGGESFGADRDEILLIEDWKIGPGGMALSAGHDVPDTPSLYTLNRTATFALTARPNERLRLRLVNGCQRQPVALKFADLNPAVVAIDSMPSEPFIARDGQIILAPGSRVDALLDVARPAGAPSQILLHDGTRAMPIGQIAASGAPVRAAPLPTPSPSAPERSTIDLRNAQRVELSLDPAQWMKAAAFNTASAPAFRAGKGRTVVLSITNGKAAAATLHLHGHHARLLDRLDDGWKPFWVDTLIFQPGQTQRIAFNAQYAGAWPLECLGTAWSSPRLLRWYSIA